MGWGRVVVFGSAGEGGSLPLWADGRAGGEQYTTSFERHSTGEHGDAAMVSAFELLDVGTNTPAGPVTVNSSVFASQSHADSHTATFGDQHVQYTYAGAGTHARVADRDVFAAVAAGQFVVNDTCYDLVITPAGAQTAPCVVPLPDVAPLDALDPLS